MDSAITPIQFEDGPTPADLTQGLVNENPPVDPDVQLLWDFGKFTGAAIETAIADAGSAISASNMTPRARLLDTQQRPTRTS